MQELENIALRAEELQENPDDLYVDVIDNQGRKKRQFKETTDDFLLDAELNVKKIANLMTQTLDMMIEMQENGQQHIVSDEVYAELELENGNSIDKEIKKVEEETTELLNMENVINKVDNILLGLGQAIDQKREESLKKLKAKQDLKARQNYKNNYIFYILTVGSFLSVLGIIYCLSLGLNQDQYQNMIKNCIGRNKSQKGGF